LTVLGGGELAEGIVGSLLVVLEHPPPCGFADIVQAQEQVLVEDLLAVSTDTTTASLPPTSTQLAALAFVARSDAVKSNSAWRFKGLCLSVPRGPSTN
jgi:hypothetical protein